MIGQGIEGLCAGAVRLEVADFSGCEISDYGVDVLARTCPELQVLAINRLAASSVISDVAMLSLARNCINLKELSVFGRHTITNYGKLL